MSGEAMVTVIIQTPRDGEVTLSLPFGQRIADLKAAMAELPFVTSLTNKLILAFQGVELPDSTKIKAHTLHLDLREESKGGPSRKVKRLPKETREAIPDDDKPNLVLKDKPLGGKVVIPPLALPGGANVTDERLREEAAKDVGRGEKQSELDQRAAQLEASEKAFVERRNAEDQALQRRARELEEREAKLCAAEAEVQLREVTGHRESAGAPPTLKTTLKTLPGPVQPHRAAAPGSLLNDTAPVHLGSAGERVGPGCGIDNDSGSDDSMFGGQVPRRGTGVAAYRLSASRSIEADSVWNMDWAAVVPPARGQSIESLVEEVEEMQEGDAVRVLSRTAGGAWVDAVIVGLQGDEKGFKTVLVSYATGDKKCRKLLDVNSRYLMRLPQQPAADATPLSKAAAPPAQPSDGAPQPAAPPAQPSDAALRTATAPAQPSFEAPQEAAAPAQASDAAPLEAAVPSQPSDVAAPQEEAAALAQAAEAVPQEAAPLAQAGDSVAQAAQPAGATAQNEATVSRSSFQPPPRCASSKSGSLSDARLHPELAAKLEARRRLISTGSEDMNHGQ
mmetsp:Transcript_83508/g.269183  ORF Transcript_83508/g.269183 Transcript_83508/m.269183 type:complete len:562 (-) Transcript_83508:95-1780(-)